MIELELPYPISVNRYWVNRTAYSKKTGRAYTARMGSKEAHAFKQEVRRIANKHGVQPIIGPVQYQFYLYPERPLDWAKRAKLDPVWWDLPVRCLDLDNARKVLIDALNGIAWVDDSFICHDPGTRMCPDGRGARCIIKVSEYLRLEHPQMPLSTELEEMARRGLRKAPLAEKPF